MIKVHVDNLYQIARFLEVSQRLKFGETDQTVKAEFGEFFDGRIDVAKILRELGLTVSLSQWKEGNLTLSNAPDASHVEIERVFNWVKIVQSSIRHELKTKLFLQVASDKASFYDSDAPWPGVSAKWPKLIEDISEASKCLALERWTAAVFHLMRVMEVGVQEFGTELGVTLATEKTWGVILNETKKPIDLLPRDDPKKIAFNEAWAHLDSVRLAWRNKVMHPKQTYTPEEAIEVFNHVGSYMQHLHKIL